MPYLINAFKTNPKYADLLENVSLFNISEYPEIFNTIIEMGKLRNISISSVGNNPLSIEAFMNALDKNPNGFHIRFEDPDTHEYISRVSGFRNGNTVFLNELRYSCNADKYTNLDVVETCKIAARRLVELSASSPYPIKNVVIANQYAMTESEETIVPFHIKDKKEGLPKFYSDIGNDGIVLATTAKETPIERIDFDKSKVPIYLPVRFKVRFLKESSELVGAINRVASIKTLLSGTDIENIDSLHFENGVIYGIVSDDWYIYVDENMNILGDYIDIDPRVKEEFLHHIEIIEQKKSTMLIKLTLLTK